MLNLFLYIKIDIYKGVLGRFQTLCAPSTITHYALRITHYIYYFKTAPVFAEVTNFA